MNETKILFKESKYSVTKFEVGTSIFACSKWFFFKWRLSLTHVIGLLLIRTLFLNNISPNNSAQRESFIGTS